MLHRIIVVLLCACALFSWAEPVQLLSQRYKTEWNWTEYRISLKNTSTLPVLNPEIRYFAENSLIQYCEKNSNAVGCRTFDKTNPPEDSLLQVAVDDVSGLFMVVPEIVPAGNITIVKLKIHGMFYPNAVVNISFRLYKKQWDAWTAKRDWSYPRKAGVVEPNYFMAVYDASYNILWGQDPLNGNTNVDAVLWSERGNNFVVEKFAGDTSEYVPAGRFWVLKDSPVSPKERDLLAAKGIVKHSGGVHQGKTLALFHSNNRVRKALLDSTVAGFYNAFPVNDTARVPVDVTPGDFFGERRVCNSDGVCHNEVVPLTEIDVDVSCWSDVSVDDCVQTVDSCGGREIGVARGFLATKVSREALQCLTGKRNIEQVLAEREAGLAGPKDRQVLNLPILQDSSAAWKAALASTQATKEWLSGVEYTGEGILVGVYDSGFDTTHPDFYEDSAGTMVLREMRREEYFGVGYDTTADYDAIIELSNRDKGWHGTHVAGILGGNGRASNNFEYRGVAPKIHFYFGGMGSGPQKTQIGHVVSHSHITNTSGWYRDDVIDEAIFKNWKSGCTKENKNGSNLIPTFCVEGDTLSKTVAFCAGNDGGIPRNHGIQRGFHSVLANSKNAIIVGNMTSGEKVRFYHSGMGPTWDGRIKPDIMAPGATNQLVASESHPIEILVDYVKFYRKGSAVPYYTLDSNSFSVSSFALSNTMSTAFVSDIGKGNFAYDFKTTSTNFLGVNPYWELDDTLSVLATDSIEVRFRKGVGWDDEKTIYGNVFFGMERMFFNNNVPVVWEPDSGFTTNRFQLSFESDSIRALYLRLEFSFIRGIIGPTECKGGTCGYTYPIDGGTSAATPFVSGIAALMYQKFRDTTGDPLNLHSMRNSTVKALMIHTAIDMEDSPAAHFQYNPDFWATYDRDKTHYTPYGKGPDFATGWGRVDAKAALDMISGYEKKSKEFAKFREIEIGQGIEKRWSTVVAPGQSRLRATLVWDDAPGEKDSDWIMAKQSKLVNDLDVYLVSPSGKYHYPWRLDTLPIMFIDSLGKVSNTPKGFERILESDVQNAHNGCGLGSKLEYDCFDHRNNVEVVDVDDPEPGKWQIVVMGRKINEFNNADSNAQVATLVSDSTLSADEFCSVVHDYAPQTDYRCEYSLGKDAVSYVAFDERTFVGAGDNIQLFDEKGALLGTYVENQLAGKTLKLKASRLVVELHSDNDKSQGWGVGIAKIKVFPKSALKMPFEFTKKKRGNNE